MSLIIDMQKRNESQRRAVINTKVLHASAFGNLDSSAERNSQRRSSKFVNRNQLFLDFKNMHYDSDNVEHIKSSDSIMQPLNVMNDNFINQIQSMLNLYGKNLKETERFIERNNIGFKEQSKGQSFQGPTTSGIKLERRKNIVGTVTSGNMVALPSVFLGKGLRANSKVNSLSNEKPKAGPNRYKFELQFDGRFVTITNFETNQKSMTLSLSDFFEKIEMYYNKFCEGKEKDLLILTDTFRELTNFYENPNKDIIERIFFINKKVLRKSISKGYLLNLMSQKATMPTIKKGPLRFNKTQMTKAGTLSTMSLGDIAKANKRRDSKVDSQNRKVSVLESIVCNRKASQGRESNLSCKPHELNFYSYADIEFLQVMYYVLVKLAKFFYKSCFSHIQQITNSMSEVELKIQHSSVLMIKSNPYLNSQQIRRFENQCKLVEKFHKENIYDLERNSIIKSLSKFGFNGSDSGHLYLKNLKRYVQRD